MADSLTALAEIHGTDKLGHGYCPIYDDLFAELRHTPLLLVELGVLHGYSLKMWGEYFTHADARILGIDNQLYGRFNSDGRVATVKCDQTELPPGFDFRPDIIIDDASHVSSKTIKSFETWFPQLADGGIYVIEDLHTSYYTDTDPNPHCHGYEGHPDPDQRGPRTSMQFCKRLADEIHAEWVPPELRLGFPIRTITFHRNMCIIKKK